jgi:UDP-xylose:glucoside alpha-1,3-xylosyltransferase
MKRRRVIFVLILLIFFFYIFKYNNKHVFKHKRTAKTAKKITEAVIALVACGVEKANLAMNSVKSALLFSAKSDRLKFIIFSDTQHDSIEKTLKTFQNYRNFSYVIRNASFPEKDNNMWASIFGHCSTQRLFFPNLLTDVDALLYVDSDTLFVSPPMELYRKFDNFTENQIAALAPEALQIDSYYPEKVNQTFPFYGEFGLNSGVKLMNLTRMRKLKYEEKLQEIFWQYRPKITYYDQDIMNIYFHDNPDQLFELPCEYNFRTDFCLTKLACPAKDGLKLIHGNRFCFRNKGLTFGQLAAAIENIQPVSDDKRTKNEQILTCLFSMNSTKIFVPRFFNISKVLIH